MIEGSVGYKGRGGQVLAWLVTTSPAPHLNPPPPLFLSRCLRSMLRPCERWLTYEHSWQA